MSALPPPHGHAPLLRRRQCGNRLVRALRWRVGGWGGTANYRPLHPNAAPNRAGAAPCPGGAEQADAVRDRGGPRCGGLVAVLIYPERRRRRGFFTCGASVGWPF